MVEPASRFVDAGGIRTHYLEAGSGPTLVLIHGGGAGADAEGNWTSCLPYFAPHYRVVALDMVGFGRTDKPAPQSYAYTQANRSGHLLAFIDALGLEPLALVGNSMGGATALGAFIARPTVARRLVLMGSAGVKVSEPRSPVYGALVNYDFTVEGMRRLVAALTAPGFRPSEAVIRRRHELSVDPATRAALEAINEEARRGGLLYEDDAIRSVVAPTLVVNGKLDQISTLARAQRFLELLENSWGYFVPHCGHWAMIEATADFCAAVRNFLELPR